MCKNEKRTHGTAARSVPVADLLASEARRPRTRVDVRYAYGDPSLCLFPGDRSRESCGTLQLPQISDVFPVVRRSRMKFPHDIRRDSWVWGEQETLGNPDSPHEVGEEALTKRSPLSGQSVPRSGGVMVVESYHFFIHHYCWTRWTAYPPSRLGPVHIFTTFVENPAARTSPPGTCFLLLWPLFCHSRTRILMNSL